MTDRRGRFIVLEGGDGAGKSRLHAALGERLAATGFVVKLLREPGGTELGERVRTVLNAAPLDDPLAELLLFEAARAHLVETVIRPCLAVGTHVLCDRFGASSVAYQSYGRGLERAVVEQANALATGGLTPDLTVLLDLPADAGLKRRRDGGGGTHFDALPLEFHQRVRAGYVELAREHSDSWRVIDATVPFDDVLDAAYSAILDVLGDASRDADSASDVSSATP